MNCMFFTNTAELFSFWWLETCKKSYTVMVSTTIPCQSVNHACSLSGGCVWLWGRLHWSDDVWWPAGPVYRHPCARDPHCWRQQGRCQDYPSLQPHPACSQHTWQGGTHLVPAALRSRYNTPPHGLTASDRSHGEWRDDCETGDFKAQVKNKAIK